MKKLFIIGVSTSLIAIAIFLFINKPVPVVEPSCEVVDGNSHIYRGQCLPEGFSPEVFPLNRRSSWLNTQQTLDLRAKIMVEELIEDAEADGICLVVTSGYRSYEEQEKLYSTSNTPEYVAVPGGSEHQTGLAVDFAACPMRNGIRDDSVEREDLEKEFEELPEYEWLDKWAWTYGFEQSFSVETIEDSQYPVENWHWKLVLE